MASESVPVSPALALTVVFTTRNRGRRSTRTVTYRSYGLPPRPGRVVARFERAGCTRPASGLARSTRTRTETGRCVPGGTVPTRNAVRQHPKRRVLLPPIFEPSWPVAGFGPVVRHDEAELRLLARHQPLFGRKHVDTGLSRGLLYRHSGPHQRGAHENRGDHAPHAHICLYGVICQSDAGDEGMFSGTGARLVEHSGRVKLIFSVARADRTVRTVRRTVPSERSRSS